ncbi:MAG: hypothetical protein WA906_10590 [Pacificimonas sp.]
MTFHRHLQTNMFAATILLFAMVVQAAVPSGWMPNDGEGWMRLTVCTGVNTVDIWMDETGERRNDSPQSGGAEPCAFTAMPSMATVDNVVIALPPPHVDVAGSNLGEMTAPGRGLTAPPPPARGPPAFLA